MPTLQESSKADLPSRKSGTASLLNGHYASPPEDKDGKLWVRASVTIRRDAQTLYDMWRHVESAPAWHERIVSVTKTGPTIYHWVMRDEPGDRTLEWDFEILSDEPGKRITWRSLSGEPEGAGEVIFESAPGDRGTMVTVLEQFRMGQLSRAWETITGRDPKQSAIENLRHFKALAETGEIPRTEPQSHGERGTIAGLKRSAYGEKIKTPRGTATQMASGQKGV